MAKRHLQGFSLLKSSLAIVLLSAMLIGLWQCTSQQDILSYNQHIRPIFNKKCLSCHGGVRQMGEFSLLFEEEAFRPAKSGKMPIVRGSHEKSELFHRITHQDAELRMPLDGAQLNPEEIDLIAKWIDQGAKWEEHWAYIPPKKVEIPEIDSDWADNSIDNFILEKLEEVGLEPAVEADRHSLLRRASLDLTGLPPTSEAINAFINDTSPDAYEKAIDRLLASPHYGERWAAMWLDLARYADSKGYEKDSHRNIWRYRDWLIEAFNRDLPFDQFTIEQLAGDLLPDPDNDQLIATAFNRNTMTNTEGGTEDEEFRVAAVIDRINTTFELWQATTISCVQCHSHPYDPIRHEEYYQVMDLFNHTLDQDLDTEIPNLLLYEGEEVEEIETVIGFIQGLESQTQVDTSKRLDHQIKQALFPALIPSQCDDFENVTFNTNGTVTNWVYNLQAIGDKKFRFKFSNIDLTNLTHISYRYSVAGEDARMEVRIDGVEGEVISATDFPKADAGRWAIDKFPLIKSAVKPQAGSHDLIFDIINTTGKIPDGMLSIGSIELHYADKFPANQKLASYKEKLIQLWGKADRTPIMQPKSATFQRTTKVFERGNRLVLGEEVKGKAPEAMLSSNVETGDRLAFAKWLVSKENPLTARVMVNRLWEQLFGMGIIESLEDFGTQSLPASHPELLDYLALQFMEEHQWSMKQLLKKMMLSATYRQSSKTTAEKLELDPFNRLLSRGPRFRLSAEQIRDQALAVSGLLSDSIGGESVMPLQPDGIWAVVYSNHQWKTAEGDQRYRRGLYTYWKRTAPFPSMVAFDSPSREFCVSRRIRTNTPLQALVTLNDPVYLEAAAVLGAKMKEKGSGDLEAAIRFGHLKAMAQEADEATVAVLKKLYHQAQEELNNTPPQVVPISDQGEMDEFFLTDPMTVVANAIMNLDGFLMKQ